MIGCHHQLNGHRFGWTLGVGDGQGGLACCDSWCHKELDRTERLICSEYNSAIKKTFFFLPIPAIWMHLGQRIMLSEIRKTKKNTV